MVPDLLSAVKFSSFRRVARDVATASFPPAVLETSLPTPCFTSNLPAFHLHHNHHGSPPQWPSGTIRQSQISYDAVPPLSRLPACAVALHGRNNTPCPNKRVGQLCMVPHTHNPSPWELEAGESGVNKLIFSHITNSRRPCLRKKEKER